MNKTLFTPEELARLPNRKVFRASLAYIKGLISEGASGNCTNSCPGEIKAISEACDVLLDALYGLQICPTSSSAIEQARTAINRAIIPAAHTIAMSTPSPTIQQFLADGKTVSEVILPPERKARNVFDDLRKQARRMMLNGNIRIRIRGNRVFIQRLDVEEGES